MKDNRQIIKDISIAPQLSVKNALKLLNKCGTRVLFVVDSQRKLLGTVGDGDIRRFILDGGDLDSPVDSCYNIDPISILHKQADAAKIKELIVKNDIQLVPVVNDLNNIIDIISASQIIAGEVDRKTYFTEKISIPVVIMAGGEGTRLAPFTKILPKPLLPIGEVPMVEIVLSEFEKQGVSKFFMTLNHKAEMIKSYFACVDKKRDISFVKENQFYGTAGSIRLLENKIEASFFVSNCDVLVKASLKDILEFHNSHKADLTMLSVIQHYKIPYGVINFVKGGRVTKIVEKPEYTFSVNAGVYLMNKSVIKEIPKNKHFDMTDLIEKLISKNKIVMTYPINENDYLDVGQWEEYRKTIEQLERFVV